MQLINSHKDAGGNYLLSTLLRLLTLEKLLTNNLIFNKFEQFFFLNQQHRL